jgi:hypothetical protein
MNKAPEKQIHHIALAARLAVRTPKNGQKKTQHCWAFNRIANKPSG